MKWNQHQKMSFRCTLSRFMAIRCVVAVNYGHFSCRYNSRIGFSMQNVYVNELNIVLLYAFCSDEFKYRYNASNLYRVTHDNGR